MLLGAAVIGGALSLFLCLESFVGKVCHSHVDISYEIDVLNFFVIGPPYD